jgi:hypothetical protein
VLNFAYASTDLYSNGGVLTLVNPPAGYPTSPTGLSAGAVWSNSGAIGVIPGITPDPTAPPVYMVTTTAALLLSTGGGNLPLTARAPGSGQLWNNGGEIAVS